MKIAVRMDDITPDMDWKSFCAFTELFEKYKIQPLLGIVPANEDPKLKVDGIAPDFWEKMKRLEEKGYVLAMHGCHHVYATKKGGLFPLNPQSEFAGKPFEEQKALLEKGQRLLREKGIETAVFMAPGHTFDRNTAKALKELGFTHITDGFGKGPYTRDGIIYFPISFLRRFAFSDREGITTLVIHANHSTAQELDNYERMFAANRDKFVPYSEFFHHPAVKQGVLARGKEYGMALGKQWAARLKRRMRHG